MTLGHQLFWLSREFPEAFARARWILPFAQYWAWGLAGVPACEVTSLGAQTQLWNPRERAFSSLVGQQGWADKFPPLRSAWRSWGRSSSKSQRNVICRSISRSCAGLRGGANIARHLAAGLDDFTLISTGEWLVVYQPHLPLAQLEPLRDTAANVDLLGRPVACARFMAGREYAAIAGVEGKDARAEVGDVAALVAAGTMALPSFTRSGGRSRPPARADCGRAAQRRARAGSLASLYLALMASACLDLLRSRGQVIIDGAFADHRLFAELLAALRPGQPVAVSGERQGAASARRCCRGGPSAPHRPLSISGRWRRPE